MIRGKYLTLLKGHYIDVAKDHVADVVAELLQWALKAIGHYEGPIDWEIGPETEASLIRFKQSAGLPADAVLDEATITALLDAAEAPSANYVQRLQNNRDLNEMG